MMYKKLSPILLLSSVQMQVEKTGKRCYDAVPLNAESPFYYAELVSITPVNNKTMYRDQYTVWIHCIAEASESSVGVLNIVTELEEALTENITLPEGFELIRQESQGVQTFKMDESGEKHAVCSYMFDISYGFRIK